MNQHTDPKRRLFATVGALAATAAIATLALAGFTFNGTTSELPADHLDSSGTQANADHQRCSSCHEGMPGTFAIEGSLLESHQAALQAYESAPDQLGDDGKQLVEENLDAMQLYFGESADDECASCHVTQADETSAFVATFESGQIDADNETLSTQFCTSCHDYGSVSQATETFWTSPSETDFNPHDSHFGEASCTSCHTIHGTTQTMLCNRCHYLDLPEGWSNPLGRYLDAQPLEAS